MGEDWQARWREGRTGWHEAAGNAALHTHWPRDAGPRRVLVPLCGKTVDLVWLAAAGCDVTGVELSELAVRAFFAEQGFECEQSVQGSFARYRARGQAITLYCGDYFSFTTDAAGGPFDALYDRGALVALDGQSRPGYVTHTDSLLGDEPLRLVVTLEYDQSRVDGPPFAVHGEEVRRYWPGLHRAGAVDDTENCPPKFRAAGLESVREVAWLTP